MRARAISAVARERDRVTAPILVLDFSGNYARDVVRCLTAAGHGRSHVLAPENCLAQHSRFVTFHAFVGTAKGDRNLMEAVERLRVNTCACILLPVDEEAIAFVARNQRVLETQWRFMPVSSPATLETVTDKSLFACHLAKYSLPQPRTKFAANASQTLAVASHVGYPLLLKPVRSPGGGAGIRRYDNELQLHAALAAGVQRASVLVQSFLPGEDEDCSVLCVDGQILAYTVQRPALPPTRPYSPAQALHLVHDDDALDIVSRLIASLRFSGVAHVDMRRATCNRKLYLIELNPRFWQTMIASLSSGVNFPELAVHLACGECFEVGAFTEITFVPWRLLAGAWARGRPLGLARPWKLRTGLRYVSRDPGAALWATLKWCRNRHIPRAAKQH